MFSRLSTSIIVTRIVIAEAFLGIECVARALRRVPARAIPVLLRRYGATVGERVNFKDNLHIDNASGDEDATGDFSNITIGDRCYIGKGVFLDLPDKIVLDNEVILSAGVKILTHADCGDRMMSRWYPRKRGAVTLGEGTWVGVNAVIMPGVTLGRCCVVAANAVVTESFPDFSVVGGVPATLMKTLEKRS